VPKADVGDIQLDYERSGEGPPLLAIMGMSGTYLHWGEPFLERLRESFEVVVYDHRGVGSSSRLEGPVTTAQLAADAAGLVRALELDSVHVLGISMGGMAAQELVLAQPRLVRTLTLGCTYCGGPGSSYGSAAGVRLSEAMASGDRARALRASYEINLSPAAAADPAVMAQRAADAESLGMDGVLAVTPLAGYGGILTDYTIASDTRFKAAISGAGVVRMRSPSSARHIASGSI